MDLRFYGGGTHHFESEVDAAVPIIVDLSFDRKRSPPVTSEQKKILLHFIYGFRAGCAPLSVHNEDQGGK